MIAAGCVVRGSERTAESAHREDDHRELEGPDGCSHHDSQGQELQSQTHLGE